MEIQLTGEYSGVFANNNQLYYQANSGNVVLLETNIAFTANANGMIIGSPSDASFAISTNIGSALLVSANSNSNTVMLDIRNANTTQNGVVTLTDNVSNASTFMSPTSNVTNYVFGIANTANSRAVGAFLQANSAWANANSVMLVGPKSFKWYGAVGDGVTDDTTAVQAALSTGGSFVVEASYVVSGVVVTANNVTISGINGGCFVNKANASTTMLKVTGDYFRIEKVNFHANNFSSSIYAALWVDADRYTIRDINVFGGSFNMRTPSIIPGPYYGVVVSASDYEQHEYGLMDHITTFGCRTGILALGHKQLGLMNITNMYAAQFGTIVGGGISVRNFQLDNFKAICCGQYGFSNSSLFGGTGPDPQAMMNWQINNAMVINSGWQSFLGGVNGSIGSGKFGYDITDQGMNGLQMKAMARNCCAGGMESKTALFSNYDSTLAMTSATTSGAVLNFASTSTLYIGMTVTGHANIPSDTYILSKTTTTVTLTRSVTGTVPISTNITFTPGVVPLGHRNVDIDFQYVTNISTSQVGQVGVGLFTEDVSAPSNLHSNHRVKVQATTEQASTWRSTKPYLPYDIVASNGLLWLCFGDSTGASNTAGFTAPPAGLSYQLLTTNGSTASGNSILNFASTTGVTTGMTVFGNYVPDGTTVVSKTSTTVTLSNPVSSIVSSSLNMIFMDICTDGTLYWGCLGTDTSGTINYNIGCNVDSLSNADLDVTSYNNGYGVAYQAIRNIDNKISNVKTTARVRNATYGLSFSGSVGVYENCTFVACDIEAITALNLGMAGGTADMSFLGGRFKSASGYSFRIDGGTNTIRFDGGALLLANTYNIFVTGGTNSFIFGSVTMESSGSSYPNIIVTGGTNTINFGFSNFKTNTGYPVLRTTGGTTTTLGRALRADRSTAPSSSTVACVGEYMVLAAPTSTEWGYYCRAADFVTPTFTWEPMK